MRLCGCCEKDCGGGYTAKRVAGWWIDFAGQFGYSVPEYQRAWCTGADFEQTLISNPYVDTRQYFPQLDPLHDSILVRGPGAVNWPTCDWSTAMGTVDRWRLWAGQAQWNVLIGTVWNCLPEFVRWDTQPIDFRTWQQDNPDGFFPPGGIASQSLPAAWFGETPDPASLPNYCEGNNAGINNTQWRFSDVFRGFRIEVRHVAVVGEPGKHRVELRLYWLPYYLNNEIDVQNWPYLPLTPDTYDRFLTNPETFPGLYPSWYNERANWYDYPTDDGGVQWINPRGFASPFVTRQPVGRFDQLFANPDFGIRACQAQKLLRGGATGQDIQEGNAGLVAQSWRLWQTDSLDGDEINGTTPLILKHVEPSTVTDNWWEFMGLTSLPDELTLTPLDVDELIEVTGDAPQDIPES